MFEERTFDVIIEEMLDRVPDDIDTREGSVIYDALAPVALELEQIYQDMDDLLNETFADSASYECLVKRAAEHGILPIEGTPAVIDVIVTPNDLDIPLDTEFSINDFTFFVSSQEDDGHYLLTCTENGTDANSLSNEEIVPLESVEGLEAIQYSSLYTAGTDDESEESIRERYFESFNTTGFRGNKADYQEYIKGIEGILGCKVYSYQDLVDDGESVERGTVKCYVTGTDSLTVSAELLASVQEKIDPTQDGKGNGIAPMGHIVHVCNVTSVPITITASYTLADGYELIDIEESCETALESYFTILASEWDSQDVLIVRKSRIQSLLLNIEGVIDVDNIVINGESQNYACNVNEIPYLQTSTMN